MNRINFKELYSAQAVGSWRQPVAASVDQAPEPAHWTAGSWRLPAAISVDLTKGLIRGLRLVWHELPPKLGVVDSAPMRFVCCDVLELDKDALIDRPTFVFARRIELGPGAAFVLDRTIESDIDLTLFAQEVVDKQTGAPAVLSITAATEKEGVPSMTPAYGFKADPKEGATGMVWQPRADAAGPALAKDIDPGHLLIGEPLWLALMTEFQVATLLSADCQDLSIAQLRWVAALGQAGPATRELAGQANATAGTLQASGPNAVLVPRLDAAIYASASKDLLAVLKEREAAWDALLGRIHSDKTWAADASTKLAETLNQDQLSQGLEDQASRTRAQAMRALELAIGQTVHVRMQIRLREIDFQSGIVRWKEKKIQSEIWNILAGMVDLLAQLPAVVAIGPELVVLPAMESLGKVGAYIVTRAKDLGTNPGGADLDAGDVDYQDMLALFAEGGVIGRPVPALPVVNAAEAKRLKDLQADLGKALAAAGKDAKAIYDSASNILSISSTAAKLQRTSQAIYKSIDGEVGSSFSTVELRGLDAVTGGEQAWDTLRVDIDAVFDNFKDGLLKEIDGSLEYRREFHRLLICGQTLSQTRLAVAKANTQVAELKLRREAARRSVDIIRARAAQLDKQVADTDMLTQFMFNTVLDAKRSVYLAMEAYGRAYRYITLSDTAQIPALPAITASVADFGKAVATISGKLLISSALSPAPQLMKQTEVTLDEPGLLDELRATKTMTWTLDPSHPSFKGFFRIRVNRVRIFADGLSEPGDIDVMVSTSGVYTDKHPIRSGPQQKGVRFISEPTYRLFRYNGRSRQIVYDGTTARRYADDFFVPTPFTVWTMKIARADGRPLDLTGLTGITLQFHGEATVE